MIAVTNKSRTMFVLNLRTGVDYGPGHAPTAMAFSVDATGADGTAARRRVQKNVPGSISWLPGEAKSGLPEAIQQIPEFQKAVADRVLVVVQ